MRDRTRFSFLFAALLLGSACSDDDKRETVDEDDGGGGGVVTGEKDSGAFASADGSVDLDGGIRVDIDGGIVLADGAIVSPPSVDGAVTDGAAPTADGSSAADASGFDASGLCDVNDPKYGCGTLSGTTWVSFPDFEVDLTNKLAWTRPATVGDDDELAGICPALTNGGFTWKLPQMEDVRKLAAGCDKTVSGGSCQVYLDRVTPGEAGDCDCQEGLMGPHNGKFCRPEVPECELLWVWTHTNDSDPYEHWFYDVATGDIVPELVGVGLAEKAKGRCVHALADGELPATLAP